jgi:hypothetical protein
MNFYERYAIAYNDFHTLEPFLRNKVPKTSRDDLERSVAQGLAFHFLVEGEEAGLIAGERRNYVGLPGLYFLELFLYKKFRGRKLASYMQQLFIEATDPDTVAFVWGTIDLHNQPSLRTALSLGRIIVSREVFLPIS